MTAPSRGSEDVLDICLCTAVSARKRSASGNEEARTSVPTPQAGEPSSLFRPLLAPDHAGIAEPSDTCCDRNGAQDPCSRAQASRSCVPLGQSTSMPEPLAVCPS
jgi:hypothetical protein